MKNGPYTLVVAPVDYPGKRYRDAYCYEHVLVYWRHTGIIPCPGEIIHHRNENKRDNGFENLELKPSGDHARHHARPKKPLVHGTINGYQKHRCRCDTCRLSNARYNAKYKRSSQLP